MLGNCEKMVLISSSPNQWPQMKNHPTSLDHDDNQKGLNLMNHSSCGLIMDKHGAAQDHQKTQHQQHQQQEPLKCPRCDSSNTKFCYYNNYSLSQPRHFCKACKRYWTRGGTLRNVPVGGGCRKNKRFKRSSSAAAATTAVAATHSSSSPAGPDSTSSSSTSCANNNNPNHPLHNLLYGSNSGYDHHLINPLGGLGFSSTNIDHRDFNLNGFNSSSLLSGYSSLFPNNPSSISSLLANSKFTNGGGGGGGVGLPSSLFQNLDSTPFDHYHHVIGSNGGDQLGMNMKDVKLEDGMKRLGWNNNNNNNNNNNQQNQTDVEIVAQSNDPNSLYANWSSQIWHDPTNLASSITSSLI